MMRTLVNNAYDICIMLYSTDNDDDNNDSDVPLDVIVGSSVAGAIFLIILCIVIYKVNNHIFLLSANCHAHDALDTTSHMNV